MLVPYKVTGLSDGSYMIAFEEDRCEDVVLTIRLTRATVRKILVMMK